MKISCVIVFTAFSFMLSVTMLSVVMPNVVAPFWGLKNVWNISSPTFSRVYVKKASWHFVYIHICFRLQELILQPFCGAPHFVTSDRLLCGIMLSVVILNVRMICALTLNVVTLSDIIVNFTAECHYAECHYAECRGAFLTPCLQKNTIPSVCSSY